jgi:hypothetical protein
MARPVAPTGQATPRGAPAATPIAGSTPPAAAIVVAGVGTGTGGQVSQVSPAVPPVPQRPAPTGTVTSFTRQITLSGTTTLAPPVMGQPGGLYALKSPADPGGDASGGSGGSPPTGQPPTVTGASVALSNPGLVTSFDGLNASQQRYANNGNQFDVVPPDQGLAVGNGDVLEVVNSVLRVYNTAGQPLTGVEDSNTSFGYPAQYN